MNYLEENQAFCEYLKEQGIKKSPHFAFFNMACQFFGSADNTIEKRIKNMHRTGLIENDGKHWVIK